MELEILDRVVGPDWVQLLLAEDPAAPREDRFHYYVLQRRLGPFWVALWSTGLFEKAPPPMAERPSQSGICVWHGKSREHGPFDIQHHLRSEGEWVHLAWSDDAGAAHEVYLYTHLASLHPEPHCLGGELTSGVRGPHHSSFLSRPRSPMAVPIDRPLTVTWYDAWGRPFPPEVVDPREAPPCTYHFVARVDDEEWPPFRQHAWFHLPWEKPVPSDASYDQVMGTPLSGEWWGQCRYDEERSPMTSWAVTILMQVEEVEEGWRVSGRAGNEYWSWGYELTATLVEQADEVRLEGSYVDRDGHPARVELAGEREGPWWRAEGTFTAGADQEVRPLFCQLWRDPRPGGRPGPAGLPQSIWRPPEAEGDAPEEDGQDSGEP